MPVVASYITGWTAPASSRRRRVRPSISPKRGEITQNRALGPRGYRASILDRFHDKVILGSAGASRVPPSGFAYRID